LYSVVVATTERLALIRYSLKIGSIKRGYQAETEASVYTDGTKQSEGAVLHCSFAFYLKIFIFDLVELKIYLHSNIHFQLG
jgi:hypothetical protein